jgi:hypothetical protein
MSVASTSRLSKRSLVSRKGIDNARQKQTHKHKGLFRDTGLGVLPDAPGRRATSTTDFPRVWAGSFDDPGSGEYSCMRHSCMCLLGALINPLVGRFRYGFGVDPGFGRRGGGRGGMHAVLRS